MNDDSKELIADDRDLSQYQKIISALEALDDVREAQVLPVGSDTSARLVALLVSENNTIAFPQLRRQLHQTSSEVLVPEELIIVDSIDKNLSLLELIDMYNKTFQQKSVYIKPGNTIETYLVELWGKFLPVGRISASDDFYVLGGHSLHVAQIHFAIKRDLGIDMDFELMLGSSKLTELAQIIIKTRRDFYEY